MAKIPVAPIGSNMPVWGVYKGDGTAKRKIELGFTPRFLSVWNFAGRQGRVEGDADGSRWSEYDGGVCTSDAPKMGDALQIVDGGFSVAQNTSYGYYLNTNKSLYIYLTFS